LEYWIVQAQENPAAPRSDFSRREWRSNTLSETLADRGHEVVRWRSAFSHQSKTLLETGNVSIPHDNYLHRFIACPPYQRHIGAARIRNHRALAHNFTKVAQGGPPPALIHVGNVPISLACAAVRYGHHVGCPVVIDIRDLWPDIYADLLPRQLSVFRDPLVKALHAGSFQLKWAMRNATAFTALTQPYMEWAIEFAGRAQTDADAVFAMSYPRRDNVPAQSDLNALRTRLGIAEGDRLAVYLGNIGSQSDFDTLLQAAHALADKYPNFKMVLAGSGPKEQALRDAAKNIPNVIVPGWLQGPEIAGLLHLAQIGLIAFHPVPNYLLNVPNKFSEYLAGGLAIACGLGGEMGRLVDKAQCGFQYPSGDAEALTRELAKVLDDPAKLDAMGTHARVLHSEQFDGAQMYPLFADHLERLARQDPLHVPT
jgi:glycosyltransferase involved in cell wall biosynthesis